MTYSKQMQYALQILLHLQRSENEYITVNDIAAKEELPRDFLSKIVQELAKWNLIDTRRGRNGGIKLGKDSESITVQDVVNVMGASSDRIHDCIIGEKSCTTLEPCSVCEGFHQQFAKDFYKTPINNLL